MARDIRNQFGRMMDSAKSGLTSVQTAIQQQTSGASYFYPSTLDLQESKRSGWLRKQSTGLTARTSWQRRWFTLKGDYMYYYASQDESKSPMGVIFLPGATVMEHVFSASDVEKFRFEIIPQGDGGQSGGSTVEGHLMSADCEDDRRDWIKTINVVLYASVGGGE